MKIGMLSQWFDPEPGPAAIPGVFAREFVAQGHQVNVLTGFPNYPDGKLYPGYRQRWRSRQRTNGHGLTRVALYPNHSSSALGRIANYTSFAASATLSGARALKGADALWVYNSPITVSLPLLTHSRGGKTPYFLHVQDLWPDSLIESGMFPGGRVGASAAAAVRRLVRITEDRASVIGVISPSVKSLILQRNPTLDPQKIIYVPNPTDETIFRPQAEMRAELQLHTAEVQPFTLMYVGAIGKVQGLDVLLNAAEVLLPNEGIRIALVGDGIARAELEADATRRGLSNVSFLGRIPKERVPEVMLEADAQLVSLGDSDFLRHTTPSKIASLLCSEVAIIGHIAGDGEELLRQSGAAFTSSPGDVDGLATAITRMANLSSAERVRMARAGRLHYLDNLSVHVAADKITASLAAVLDSEYKRNG